MIKLLSRRYNIDEDRIGVVANNIRATKDADFIWKIVALDGKDTGREVAVATQVALTGPVGCMPSTRMITGHLATQPIWLSNPTYHTKGIWSPLIVMEAALLTSDGEVWTVHRRSPKARTRFWDNSFNDVDAPRKWQVING